METVILIAVTIVLLGLIAWDDAHFMNSQDR